MRSQGPVCSSRPLASQFFASVLYHLSLLCYTVGKAPGLCRSLPKARDRAPGGVRGESWGTACGLPAGSMSEPPVPVYSSPARVCGLDWGTGPTQWL